MASMIAVQALFNNESSSDLVLTLSEVKFYVHKAVMIPACSMIEQYVKWPQDDTDNCLEPRAICDIVLPDMAIPKSFGSFSVSPDVANRLFGQFLRTIYGLVEPSEFNSIQDVFSVLIIANFMLANGVKDQCELELIERIVMETSNWIDVIRFSFNYNLSQLLNKILEIVGKVAHQGSSYLQIHKMEVRELLAVLEHVTGDPVLIYEVLLKYCSKVNPGMDIIWEGNDDKIIITQQDRLECLIKGYEILSESWTTSPIIIPIYNRTSRIAVQLESGQDFSHFIIFKIVSDRMNGLIRTAYRCRFCNRNQ